jgi:hypothetical protein
VLVCQLTGMSADAAPASDSVRRAMASVAQYPSSHAAASAPADQRSVTSEAKPGEVR